MNILKAQRKINPSRDANEHSPSETFEGKIEKQISNLTLDKPHTETKDILSMSSNTKI